MSTRFDELLDRFFYRPDEAVGSALEWVLEEQAPVAQLPEEKPDEFLAFTLAGETYAVPIGTVREIFKVGHVTQIPRARRNVIGLINVRGEMLPLYDVKVRLRLASRLAAVRGPAEVGRWARIILLKDEQGDAGVLVDQVEGVVKLHLSSLEPTPEWGGERSAIAGLGRSEERLYILLDVEQALA